MMRNIIYYILILLSTLYSADIYGQCLADFEFDDSSIVVTFEDQSIHIINDPIIEWEWNFGDGILSDNQSPIHIYSEGGAYDVSLAIATESGCMDTTTQSIYICDFDLDYDLQVGCDEDNKVTLDLHIQDIYGNAGLFNVMLDGAPFTTNPVNTINDTVSLNTELLADGQEHIISIQSIEHTNCNLLEIITLTACVAPCNISNLKAIITNSDTTIAQVLSQGYNPQALNISTGNHVLFQWDTDERSVTSTPNNNIQDWDSGILNSEEEFLLYSFAPGIYTYSSSNLPQGFVVGSLVSTCPDTAYYDVQLTFENDDQTGPYQLWIDGVPTNLPEMQYSLSGHDTILLTMPGDGILHNYNIIDVASPSCNLIAEIQAPLCGVDSDCNLHLEAAQATPCDQDSIVEVTLTILSAGGSDLGFDLYIDDILVDENIPYTGTVTNISKSLFGDGEEHIIAVIDTASDTCSATTSILLEDCSQPCLIINPFAGVGSNNNLIVSVLNDSFSPIDITISSGDKVIWQWQTDTLRSVTAIDFLFDSGVQGPGASYTSPILPVGVHRYFSEFNGMEGSITVEPNCSNGLIPIVYTFSKFGGANTGYDVFVDSIKINSSPIPYQSSGINNGNSFVLGNGAIHEVVIIDAVDSSCQAIQSFEVPFCDASTCAIFLEDPVISECADNNTIAIEADLLSFNTTDSMFLLTLDGVINDTIMFDTSGVTPLDILFAGDGALHTIIVSDLSEPSCADTLSFTAPTCSASCTFAPIEVEYLLESPMDSCFDGSTQILISTEAVQDFNSDYIISLTSSTIVNSVDTFAYPLDGLISHIYTLPADGSEVQLSISNSENEACSIDTSFSIFSCAPDPCNLTLIDLQFDDCREGGIMDMTIELDTFRISDSLSIEIDGVEIFRGLYTDFYSDPSFEIIYTGAERSIRFFDLGINGCRASESFFTPFCAIDCILSASYMLVDSCILAQDTTYAILVTGDVFNAISDSVRIDVVSANTSETFPSSLLAIGISIDIAVLDDNPTIGIFDTQDNNCRVFLAIEPPTCILDCSIEITDITAIEGECTNGERDVTIKLDYDLPLSDSIQFFIDGALIMQIEYPSDSMITTTWVGDGLIHNFVIRDAQNELCGDTLSTIIEECEFSCLDFIADFDFIIDTLTQTVNFTDMTTGGSDTWSWDLGDGTVSSDANPFHTYSAIGTYTICLVVENSEGNCSQEICDVVELIDINCTASFDFVAEGLNLSFTNTSTVNSEIVSSLWTINAETEIEDSISASFTAEMSGDVELCLSIETESGCTDTHCEIINLIKPCDLTPSFDFNISFDTIQLNNTSQGDITVLSWTLGDGSTLVGDSIQYVYPEDGDYDVCLTIADATAQDCTFTLCESIAISSCELSAVFLVNINQDTLNAELVSALDGNQISWDFGNGFSANIDPIQFVYTQEGDFTVCATVTDLSQANCSETHCENISILISDVLNDQLLDIELYPNPIRRGELLTIVNKELKELDIVIHNELGQKMIVQAVNHSDHYAIPTEIFVPGKYLVTITSNHRSITKTIIIVD